MKFSKIILHLVDGKINDCECNMNQKEGYNIYHWEIIFEKNFKESEY